MKLYKNSKARQTGGTLTGLIIGLVVGLGIAVAVALMITKSSSPFTNKFGKPADQPTTQLQDPNKPLYGNKDASKDAAKDFVKESNPEKPVDVAAVPVQKPADAPKAPAVAPPTVEKVVAPTKMADKVDTKPADTAAAAGTAKTDLSDDRWIYYLQTGAFRDQADAENARAKLALIGFEGRISERASDTGNLYRVRIGPFAQLETMNRMRSRLSENGIDVAVVRTPK